MKCNCFFLTERVSNLGGQLSYDSGETGIYLFHKKKHGDNNIYEDNGGLVQKNFLNGILETLRDCFRRNE